MLTTQIGRGASLAAALALSLTAALAPSSPARGEGDQRLVTVPGSGAVLKLFEAPDASGRVVPHYAISLDGRTFSEPRATSYNLKLRHGDFDPLALDGAPAVEAGFEAAEDSNLYIVQYLTQPLEAFSDAIAGLGGEVLWYLAHHSQIVRLSPEALPDVEALPFVRWVGAYHPAYRIEPWLLQRADEAYRLYPWQRYNIMLIEPDQDCRDAITERIAELGGAVDRAWAGKFIVEASLTPEQLFEVIRLDAVLWVDRWSPMEDDMNNSRAIGGANYVETAAGYTGQGVRGEVYDSGFNTSHVDFASRPLLIHGSAPSGSHGASTSGICFGDGTHDPNARGLLPSGQGIVAAYGGPGLHGPARYTHSGELLDDPYYAVFQTCSAGDNRTTQYTAYSAEHDAIMFDFDILFCQSQSNAGDQMSRPQAWAKNIISGGGVYHYDTLTKDDDCWCGGASIGPAADGRIKPDLTHFYDDIFTVTSGSPIAYTTGFGGTSGATPNICGYTGLFFQMWSEGIFNNPVNPNGTVFENRSHMTTAKAMMINTASQYPFTGTSHDKTRVHQGWGMPDIQYLYDQRENMLIVDETEILSNLQSIAYNVGVSAGEEQFKVTLVFADPPGNPASSQARINDLSLKVTAPDGTVYWGNNGLLANNYSTPGGDPNSVDTVECVFVQNPAAGLWGVEVIAHEIVQDSHVETPQVDADFALVVSGAQPGPGFGLDVTPPSHVICAPTEAVYAIEVEQFMGYTQPVTLSAAGAPPGTTVTFTNNPVTPPGNTTMTVSDTASGTPGWYDISITGVTPDMERTAIVGLGLSTAAAGPVSLIAPANGAVDVSIVPTLEWSPATQALTYDLQVATDAGFANIVYAATVEETSHDLATPLDPVSTYFWRVGAENTCGGGGWSDTFTFTTSDVPSILLVDDDDNSPDVRSYYTDTLDAMGLWYDIWDTNNSDDEPNATELAQYEVVVWFTGDEFGGACGPGSAGEAALATWLDNGGCFFISSQDYHYDRDLTPFMQSHLAVASCVDDEYQDVATGAGSVFGGMGPYNLSYPFSNWSDIVHPSASGELAFAGDVGDLATNMDGGVFRTTFWGFPFEAVSSLAEREDLMQTFFDWCAGLAPDCPADVNGDGVVDVVDLLAVLAAWGNAGGPEDINGDGIVSVLDLLELLSAWGPC